MHLRRQIFAVIDRMIGTLTERFSSNAPEYFASGAGTMGHEGARAPPPLSTSAGHGGTPVACAFEKNLPSSVGDMYRLGLFSEGIPR